MKQRNRITKQVKQELKQLIDNFGYWSNEVQFFLSSFTYNTATKLSSAAQAYEKYNYQLEV